jgi:hypothetical protein
VPYPGEHIQTIESKFGQAVLRMFDTPESEALRPPPHTWPAYLYSAESRRGFYAPPQGTRDQPTVYARVNHGRWQTACPFCSTVQDASPADRWLYCAICHNGAVDGASVPVAWPDDKDEIERLLLQRPLRDNRYWSSHESVAQLVEENISIGVDT